MKKRKALALALSAAMAITMIPGMAFADEGAGATASMSFVDMPSDWSTAALENAVKNGLISGYETDAGRAIKPQGNLTRAEMATIVNKAFGASAKASLSGVNDVASGEWYADQIARGIQMGTFARDAQMRPNASITRQEAMAVLARAFKLEDNAAAADKFGDARSIASWAKGSAGAMAEAGYVAGTNGNLNPTANISRAEFAKIMDGMASKYFTGKGSFSAVPSKGNVIINTPDVTLKDVKIAGDLILGDGIGNGEVTLDGVIVSGKTLVRGGGSDSVNIMGNSNLGTILVANANNTVRLHATGTVAPSAAVTSSVILDGAFKTITLTANGLSVVAVKGARVETMAVEKAASSANIEVQSGATVTNLQVAAANTAIKVDGTVKTIDVASGADGTNVEIAKTAKVENLKTAASIKMTGAGSAANITGTGKVNNLDTSKFKKPVTGSTSSGGRGYTNFSVESVILNPEKKIAVVMATVPGIQFSMNDLVVTSVMTPTGYELTLSDYPLANQTYTLSVSADRYNTYTKAIEMPKVTFVSSPSAATLDNFTSSAGIGQSMAHKIARGLGLTVSGIGLDPVVTGSPTWQQLANTESGTVDSNGYLTLCVNVTDLNIKSISLNPEKSARDTLAKLDGTGENALENAFWLNVKIFDTASRSNLLRNGMIYLLDGTGNIVAVAPYTVDATGMTVTDWTGAPEVKAAGVPVIRKQPAKQTVSAYGKAEFRVAADQPASGAGILSYQWQKSSDNGINYNPINNATGAALTVDQVPYEISGMLYRCIVTNEKDGLTASTATSAAASLTVTVPQPAKQSVTKVTNAAILAGYQAAGITFDDKASGTLTMNVPTLIAGAGDPLNTTIVAIHGAGKTENPIYAGFTVDIPSGAAAVALIGKGSPSMEDVFKMEYKESGGDDKTGNVYYVDLNNMAAGAYAPDGVLSDWIPVAAKDGKVMPSAQTAYYKWFDGQGKYIGFTTLIVNVVKKDVDVSVTFNANGGSAPAIQNLKAGDKIEAPVSTKADSVLNGWYTDADLTMAFDFSQQIWSNTMLFAKWDVFNPHAADKLAADQVTSVPAFSVTVSGPGIIAIQLDTSKIGEGNLITESALGSLLTQNYPDWKEGQTDLGILGLEIHKPKSVILSKVELYDPETGKFTEYPSENDSPSGVANAEFILSYVTVADSKDAVDLSKNHKIWAARATKGSPKISYIKWTYADGSAEFTKVTIDTLK